MAMVSDVRTGDKGPVPRAFDDDDRNAAVGRDSVDHLIQFVKNIHVDAVEHLGTVHRDPGNFSLDFKQNRVVVHTPVLLPIRMRVPAT